MMYVYVLIALLCVLLLRIAYLLPGVYAGWQAMRHQQGRVKADAAEAELYRMLKRGAKG